MSRQLSELRRHPGAVLGVAGFVVLALVLTATVAGTLARARPANAITVTAVFRDATGLRAGDDVRVAGVRVGRVESAEVGTGDRRGLAVVTMSVDPAQHLGADATASVDYLNLMGQRYVALSSPPGRPSGDLLADGATIPLSRTNAALDLTALFNAFQPVFDLLQPGDINQLAANIVQVLQGQGSTLRDLLRQTAELTNGITDRDRAISAVVDNVNLVLRTTDAHRQQIDRLVDGLDSLTSGLAQDRDRIASSLQGIARLSSTTADLVDSTGPQLIDLSRLSQPWFGYLASRLPQLTATGSAVPEQLDTYLRTLGYGSYLNVYVCTLAGQMKGFPYKLDLGVTGNHHSRRCR